MLLLYRSQPNPPELWSWVALQSCLDLRQPVFEFRLPPGRAQSLGQCSHQGPTLLAMEGVSILVLK